jgi:hypothetical protein
VDYREIRAKIDLWLPRRKGFGLRRMKDRYTRDHTARSLQLLDKCSES